MVADTTAARSMPEILIEGQTPLPAAPRYGHNTVAEVFSSAAAVLGDERYTNVLNLPEAQRICVVLVDGLGRDLLKRKAAHAPFLRQAMAAGQGQVPATLQAAFPTTTATSLTSLGTGAAPGAHGMLGYDVLDPEQDKVVNLLGGWDAKVDSKTWQPVPTVFEKLHPNIPVATVSLPHFEHSGMTAAALRGGEFHGATSPQARIQTAAETLANHSKVLVYLYWNELDKAGHSHGADSPQWERQLEDLDYSMSRLAATAPTGTLILLTADHGMVDVPRRDREDYSLFPELLAGVRHTAGEPRMVQLYLEPHADAAALKAAWLERYGKKAWVLSRDEAIAAGLYGDVSERNRQRIGDLLIIARESLALYDLRRTRAESLEMVGQHGSLTKAEREVPLILLPTAAAKKKPQARRR